MWYQQNKNTPYPKAEILEKLTKMGTSKRQVLIHKLPRHPKPNMNHNYTMITNTQL